MWSAVALVWWLAVIAVMLLLASIVYYRSQTNTHIYLLLSPSLKSPTAVTPTHQIPLPYPCHPHSNFLPLSPPLDFPTAVTPSYGKCLHNRDEPILPEDPKWPKLEGPQRRARKVKILSHYKFYLAFENLAVADYVSEKVGGRGGERGERGEMG